MDFTEEQLHRYARHIILPEVGGAGQASLMRARVLVVGAGGLGSPLLLYLAAAGVGTIGVIDPDTVELSNLQRQVIHGTDAIGRLKVDSAADSVKAINPEVEVIRHPVRLDSDNAADIIAGYDLVADGSDNFATRFLINDACYLLGKPLVSAAVLRFDGQVYTFRAHEHGPDGARKPCYRCIFPEAPPPGAIPSCAEGGVMGALAGMVGSLQAVEVIKEIVGIGDSLAGHMLVIDALSMQFRKVRVRPDPNCRLCGPKATITEITSHVHADS